ncbi:MAG TPA: pyridoxal 5'-phosphate synthase glutaminase subunit PdxT [Limnochordales bacterium]
MGLRRFGVLAFQGSVQEHQEALRRLEVEVRPVRRPEDLEGLEGLVLPGGESTTMRRLLAGGLGDAIRQAHARGMALFGTCAGLILLASRIVEQAEPGVVPGGGAEPGPGLGVLDVTVARNGYGRQPASFEAPLALHPPLDGGPFPGVFIRAPRIVAVGPQVRVLATLEGQPVAVQAGRVMGCAFHPELTGDLRLHRYFVDVVARSGGPGAG